MKTRRATVIRWLAGMVALLLGFTARAEDWQTTITTKPGTFPLMKPLTARYGFGWSGVKAAESEAKFSRIKGGRLQLETKGRTVGASRVLWRMDTTASSICQASTLRPIRLQQVETYSDSTLTTTADFSSKGAAVLRVPKPPDATPPKVKRFKFADIHDLHSALLFTRSQSLTNGQKIRLCVYPASSPYLADITVAAREKIKAAGREWPTIRCDLRLQSIGKDFTLTPHRKFKRATIWISDDAERLPVRLEAEIFIGRVWVELEQVQFAKK